MLFPLTTDENYYSSLCTWASDYYNNFTHFTKLRESIPKSGRRSWIPHSWFKVRNASGIMGEATGGPRCLEPCRLGSHNPNLQVGIATYVRWRVLSLQAVIRGFLLQFCWVVSDEKGYTAKEVGDILERTVIIVVLPLNLRGIFGECVKDCYFCFIILILSGFRSFV